MLSNSAGYREVHNMGWLSEQVHLGGDPSRTDWKPVFMALTDKDMLLYEAVPFSREDWSNPFMSHPLLATRWIFWLWNDHPDDLYGHVINLLQIRCLSGIQTSWLCNIAAELPLSSEVTAVKRRLSLEDPWSMPLKDVFLYLIAILIDFLPWLLAMTA